MSTEKHEWLKFRDFVNQHPEAGEKALRQLAMDGRIPAVRVGKRLLIRSDALDVLAEQQRKDGTLKSLRQAWGETRSRKQ